MFARVLQSNTFCGMINIDGLNGKNLISSTEDIGTSTRRKRAVNDIGKHHHRACG